jgi:glycosyltransferase involved in cell wall biosynthesis
MRSPSKVVFVGQFPPPVNGLSFVTSGLAFALSQAGYKLVTTNIAGPARARSLCFHGTRFLRTLHAMGSIASNRLSGKSNTCYFTADGGLGLAYSIIISAWARIFLFRIFIHHHSYNYITRWHVLMATLLAVSGSQAIHICLSSEMTEKLSDRYRRSIRSLVLSNAAFVDLALATPKSATRRQEQLTIGLLSNLTPDKGLYEFLEIIEIAKAKALPIRGVLAGPVASEVDRSVLNFRQSHLGDYLDYRGAVYGAEKARFFEDIDIFVFPTTYLNEAQPIVIFEALAKGIPVISFDRGSIASQVGRAGKMIHAADNFVLDALKVLEYYRQNPEALSNDQSSARDRYDDARRAAQYQIAELFSAIPSRRAFQLETK